MDVTKISGVSEPRLEHGEKFQQISPQKYCLIIQKRPAYCGRTSEVAIRAVFNVLKQSIG
jgi:hypothetical protein